MFFIPGDEIERAWPGVDVKCINQIGRFCRMEAGDNQVNERGGISGSVQGSDTVLVVQTFQGKGKLTCN